MGCIGFPLVNYLPVAPSRRANMMWEAAARVLRGEGIRRITIDFNDRGI